LAASLGGPSRAAALAAAVMTGAESMLTLEDDQF
jgi:hypothetical protein